MAMILKMKKTRTKMKSVDMVVVVAETSAIHPQHHQQEVEARKDHLSLCLPALHVEEKAKVPSRAAIITLLNVLQRT